MPARKLSQADLDDLRDADGELLQSRPRQIVRVNGAGAPRTITTQAGIAAWKGISESHFHALKRAGWRLKRGVPYQERHENGDMVPAAVLKATFELMQNRLEAKDHRIAELEAEVERYRDLFHESANNR
jgi:hypothetical protein